MDFEWRLATWAAVRRWRLRCIPPFFGTSANCPSSAQPPPHPTHLSFAPQTWCRMVARPCTGRHNMATPPPFERSSRGTQR
eukprot:scaffold107306_cov30-Tisochrysis_lutea.AAC.2